MKTKKYERGGRVFLFETTYEPWLLNKLNLVEWNIMDIPKSFIWIITLTKLLNKAVVRNWGYIGANSELLCENLYYYVRCHVLMSYVTLCLSVRLCAPPILVTF
jgi:hypothetical protein